LNLLFEGFSEPDAREILVYGMYVKINLESFAPASHDRSLQILPELRKVNIASLLHLFSLLADRNKMQRNFYGGGQRA
jgi:hypothetical protein